MKAYPEPANAVRTMMGFIAIARRSPFVRDLTNFGFVIVGIFATSWIVSSVVYRAKGYDRLGIDGLGIERR